MAGLLYIWGMKKSKFSKRYPTLKRIDSGRYMPVKRTEEIVDRHATTNNLSPFEAGILKLKFIRGLTMQNDFTREKSSVRWMHSSKAFTNLAYDSWRSIKDRAFHLDDGKYVVTSELDFLGLGHDQVCLIDLKEFYSFENSLVKASFFVKGELVTYMEKNDNSPTYAVYADLKEDVDTNAVGEGWGALISHCIAIIAMAKYAPPSDKEITDKSLPCGIRCVQENRNDLSMMATHLDNRWFTKITCRQGHTRKGHMRWQAFGPGWKSHKLIWIDETEIKGGTIGAMRDKVITV